MAKSKGGGAGRKVAESKSIYTATPGRAQVLALFRPSQLVNDREMQDLARQLFESGEDLTGIGSVRVLDYPRMPRGFRPPPGPAGETVLRAMINREATLQLRPTTGGMRTVRVPIKG